MFPDEEAAIKWFERVRWPDERACPRCGCTSTSEVANRHPMPYWCRDCRRYFSVRTGTALECSRLPLRKWAFAIYIYVTNLKSVSSMKLRRDLRLTQKTSWFLLHRLREAWGGPEKMDGPVEVDETYFGGKRKNMHASKRKALWGRGPVGKVAVVGMKDRKTKQIKAKVVKTTTQPELQGFVREGAKPGSTVYTDEHRAYFGLRGDYRHSAVQHKIKQFVDGQAHTNGIESFWATLKRAYQGTFHRLSPKHLDRYIQEFCFRHNIRDKDTIIQMGAVVAGLVGRRLMYADLVADDPSNH